MPTHRLLPTLALLLAFSLPACDSADPLPPPPPPSVPTLTGQYLGTQTLQGATFTMEMQLIENNGVVNGNGTITFAGPTAFSATGTYNFPNVALTIRSSGLEDLNFTGTLAADGNSLSGTLNGASQFDNFGITLRRQ